MPLHRVSLASAKQCSHYRPQAIIEKTIGLFLEPPSPVRVLTDGPDGKKVAIVKSALTPVVPAQPLTEATASSAHNPYAVLYRQPTGWSSGSDNVSEDLIPIRLNCEHNGVRHRDILLWNSAETALTVCCGGVPVENL